MECTKKWKGRTERRRWRLDPRLREEDGDGSAKWV